MALTRLAFCVINAKVWLPLVCHTPGPGDLFERKPLPAERACSCRRSLLTAGWGLAKGRVLLGQDPSFPLSIASHSTPKGLTQTRTVPSTTRSHLAGGCRHGNNTGGRCPGLGPSGLVRPPLISGLSLRWHQQFSKMPPSESPGSNLPLPGLVAFFLPPDFINCLGDSQNSTT